MGGSATAEHGVIRRWSSREITVANWVPSFVITLVGLAVSIYLTVEHYSASTTLACPETGVINCAKVTQSSWSKIGPVPLALLGAIYFAGMVVLCLPQAWRMARLDRLRVAGAALGVVMALYLVWVELFRLDAICLWCTVVHVATLALLMTVLWTTSGLRSPGS
jgi:uncharacterized membrane protein